MDIEILDPKFCDVDHFVRDYTGPVPQKGDFVRLKRGAVSVEVDKVVYDFISKQIFVYTR